MKTIRVAITGFGTIGKAIARLLSGRRAYYRDRFDVDVRITGVCGSSAGLSDVNGLERTALDDAGASVPGLTGERFIGTVHADLLFEASPTDFHTGGAALRYMRAALRRRMHVIAVSKGALALDYAGLRQEALRQRVALKISGATSAALPTIDLLQYNLAGCEVLSLEAILTGTTNVILSGMSERGTSFPEALQEAQKLGIAEADPSIDVEGWDTACKLTILANAAFGAALDVRTLPRQGITHVATADIKAWRAERLTPRLVGHIDRSAGETRAGVELRLYDPDHPFSGVTGRMKAIRVTTDLMGDFTIVGGGSDPVATAAAALKDFDHVLAALSPTVC